jgi:uncharacterized protein YjdB
MKNFLSKTWLLLHFLLTSWAANATDYYVSTTGNDNTGNGSQGSPWQTVHKAASVIAASGQQGHKIIVAAGTYVFTQRLDLPAGTSLQGSLTSDSTVFTFGPNFTADIGWDGDKRFYSAIFLAAATNTVPQVLSNFKIDGQNKHGWGGIFVKERTNVEIKNVRIVNTKFVGIWLWDVTNSSFHDSKLKNCAWDNGGYASGAINMNNVTNTNLYNLDIQEGIGIGTDPHKWGYGIKALPSGKAPGVNVLENVKLYGSTFRCANTTVIPVSPGSTQYLANFALEWHNADMKACEIYGNTFYNGISLVSKVPFIAQANGARPVIVHDNKFKIPEDDNSYAIELFTDYVEVRRNDIQDGIFPIAVWENSEPNVKCKGWLIHHNTFYNNKYQIFRAQIGVDDLEFYNNSAYTSQASFSTFLMLNAESDHPVCNNIKIKNNIFKYGGASQPTMAGMEGGATNGTLTNSEGTHNVLFNVTAGNKLNTVAANPTGDPLFTGGIVPQPYFLLQSTSSAKNIGTDVGFTNATYNVTDGQPDAGAYEYVAPNVPVTSVSVSPTTLSVAVGANSTLTKTISPANATNQTVTWTSSNTSIATVNASGVVTGVAAGSATITVTTQDGNKTATCAVTVVIPVTSVSVSPTTLSLAVGANSTLTKTISPANATNQTVTWSSSNTNIATVNASGVVTGVAAGSATITVTTQDGNKTATCAVTVVVPVSSVSVSPTTLSLAVGANSTLTKTISPANATNQTVTWTSSNTNIATVNASGVVTGVAAGSATITVTTQDGNKTATCAVTVVVPVSSVSVSPTTLGLAVGANSTLTKTISPANATNQTVTWSSSNTSIATVDASGVVTGVAVGGATITVTTQDGNKTATATVTVTSPGSANVVSNSEFDSGLSNWFLGDWTGPSGGSGGNTLSVQSANLSGANAAYVNVVTTHDMWRLQLYQPLSGFTLQAGKTYEISFMAKAQAARTIKAVLRGSSTNTEYWKNGNVLMNLTTTPQTFGPYTFTCGTVNAETSFDIAFFLAHDLNDVWIDKVSVRDISSSVSVTGVTVAPTTVSLTMGGTTTQQLTATVTPANATNKNLAWTSNNTSVATVNASGLVTAIGAGTCTITATTQDGSYTSTSGITVNATTIVDNAVTGTSTNQHNYTGANWTHVGSIAGWYNGTMSYSNVTNQFVTISFVGNKIEWYTEKKNTHGIAAVSIDNGAEVQVDLYAASAQTQVLVWTSPTLTQGTHTFKIRATGLKNAASSNTWAIHDFVKIYSSAPTGGGGGTPNYLAAAGEGENAIVVYPNPVKHGETLYLDLPKTASDVKLIDPLGRAYGLVPVEGKVAIGTSALPRGLSFLRYRDAYGLKYSKVIIE